jgi:hypothetical protein
MIPKLENEGFISTPFNREWLLVRVKVNIWFYKRKPYNFELVRID